MAIGFIRNDETFTLTKIEACDEELDLAQIWEVARDPSSLETRLADEQVRMTNSW